MEKTGDGSKTAFVEGCIEPVNVIIHGSTPAEREEDVVWTNSDGICVCREGAEPVFLKFHSGNGTVAKFSAPQDAGGMSGDYAFCPSASVRKTIGDSAVVNYPSTYVYDGMPAKGPLSARISGDRLYFRHIGGLLRINVPEIPLTATVFRLVADNRKIVGNFTVALGDCMTVFSGPDADNDEVKIVFPSGVRPGVFNIPLPTGSYGNISARFENQDGEVLYGWTLAENLDVERAKVYVCSPENINGTLIDPNKTRVGLVCDANTLQGIEGVYVTDGFTYTVTDKNGVYQFDAHEDSRAVYLSHPAGYDLPVDENGQLKFWAVGGYRNDFRLKPCGSSWDEFSILAMSDVHFFNKGASSTVETERFSSTVLPDINDYICNFDNIVALNLGDIVSNYSGKLPEAKAQFAKIRKGGRTVPMLMTIGNHDYSNAACLTALESSRDYFETFGPLDYSVNIGKAHIVSMSNVIFAGNAPGGYGKSINYEKGLTDEQWRWLEADLATVSDKEDKILLLCFHVPVFANSYPYADKIRAALKTFGESHIFSGHNHYNVLRQFTDTWNGLSGRISEEHNLPATGGLWRSNLENDGSPVGYHVYTVRGNQMTGRNFKAVGHSAGDMQFRVYDGGDSYAESVACKFPSLTGDIGGICYFDWKTLWEPESSEGFDPTGHFIVRVFDAGSRGIGCKVYFNKDGVRTEMKRSEKSHRDQCAFAYLWNNGKLNSNSAYGSAYLGGKTQTFWYIKAPSGNPSAETGWKVEVEFLEAEGVRRYESDVLQKDFSGFECYL